jgi:hypothetical protein
LRTVRKRAFWEQDVIRSLMMTCLVWISVLTLRYHFLSSQALRISICRYPAFRLTGYEVGALKWMWKSVNSRTPNSTGWYTGLLL